MKLFLFSIFLTSIILSSSSLDHDDRVILTAIVSAFDKQDLFFENTRDVGKVSGYVPQVETTVGRIRGVGFPEAHGFYRIPYGQAPVQDMRFKRSIPVESFPNNEINATEVGRYSCYQQNDDCANGTSCEALTEDCLFLNVHVPNTVDLSDSTSPPSEKLPVLFWIHGGSLLSGSGTSITLDGRYLSNVTEVIVVTINYRLGALGFLAVRDGDDVISNQGLGDQQLALQWVQEHIQKFGGDKNKVTIAGSSAGAQSVMFHLMSEKSSNLFHQAIMQSQPAFFQYPSVGSALNITEQLLANTKCTGGGVQCLRELDPYELVKQATQISAQSLIKGDMYGAIEPFRFVLDGKEFYDNPIQFVQKGGWFGNKRAIYGTSSDEMITVPIYIPDWLNTTYARFERTLQFLLGDEVGKAVAIKYDSMAEGMNKDYQFILGDIATDGFFICPNRALARLSSSSPVFLYSFAHVMNGSNCEDYWSPSEICGYSFHASEIPFVFRTDPLIHYDFTKDDASVSNQLSYYWGNFALSGDPSSGDVTSVGEFPEWPEYAASSPSLHLIHPMMRETFRSRNTNAWVNYVIKSPIGTLDFDYKGEICNFWDDTKYYVDLDLTTTKAPVEETTSGAANKKMSLVVILVCALVSLIRNNDILN